MKALSDGEVGGGWWRVLIRQLVRWGRRRIVETFHISMPGDNAGALNFGALCTLFVMVCRYLSCVLEKNSPWCSRVR